MNGNKIVPRELKAIDRINIFFLSNLYMYFAARKDTMKELNVSALRIIPAIYREIYL